ncbi:MAG: ribonuclease P protein component [Steroidobacteraceae bacterium]
MAAPAPDALPPRQKIGFPAQRRILKASSFERVYAARWRISDSYFSANLIESEIAATRLGLSVGAKAVGNAVSRNRIKRLVRESFRQHLPQLPALDIVIGARAPASSAHNARLFESLAELWTRIARACEAPPKV